MNELATEKYMTIKEISEVFNVSRGLIEKRVRELFPNKMRHGVTTLLNEAETTIISIRIKENPRLISKYHSLRQVDSLLGTSYGREELESC